MQIIKDIDNYLLTNTRKKRKLWFIQKEPFWADICIEFNRLRLSDTMQLQQKIWHVLNNTSQSPVCIECGKPAKWQNSYGEYGKYGEFCNKKCSSTSDIKIKRIKDAYLAKHGVDNPFANKEIQEKIKQTNLERYGVDNISKLDYIKQQKANTMYSNYGRRHNLEIMEELMMNKHGVTNPAHLPHNEVNMTNRFKKTYDISLPSGNIVSVQGYERFAIPYLLKEFDENDILIGKRFMPKIEYNGNKRYFPDFYIKDRNIVIEVKSQYTLTCDFTKNCSKFHATLSNGIELILLIFNKYGEVLQRHHWRKIEDLDCYLNSLI